MKKIYVLMLVGIISTKAYALSQNDISAQEYPEAFNASTCVKASYLIDDSVFIASGYEKGTDFRMKIFNKLGKGKYAPNGKYVVANFNIYVATQGKKEASKFLWDNFNCKDLL